MTLRELNRATLARQMLLAREKRPVVKAVEQLLALQAQLPRPPFTGLWSRLQDFSRAELAAAVHKRTVVRATSMRGTIHLMTAADFLKFRACLQPSLDAGMQAILRERADALDTPALLAVARAYFATPHTFEDARDHLVSKFPRGDQRAMGYAARMGMPLVQVPSSDAWAYPARADFVGADTWLGKPVAACASLGPMVLRYLSAYGPSTVKDAQAWTGLGNLEPVFASLGSKLVTLTGPSGKPLLRSARCPPARCRHARARAISPGVGLGDRDAGGRTRRDKGRSAARVSPGSANCGAGARRRHGGGQLEGVGDDQ